MAQKISIVVPVYNDPKGLDDTLKSLVAQDYPPDEFEIVVADNGSPASTVDVIRRYMAGYPVLVRCVVEDTVRSSYAARNKGIREASGEILAFTDADCVPERDWIAAGVAALQKEAAAAGGGRIEFTFRSGRPNVFEYFDSARKLNQQTYVEEISFAATANFFARKELFCRYGLFRPDLVSGGDYEFGRRVTAQGGKLIYIADALVYHPARSSFSAIRKKSSRVALGQKQLDRLGLLEHGRLSLRQILPVPTWPMDSRWANSLTPLEKVQLLLLQNFVRWLNVWVRVT